MSTTTPKKVDNSTKGKAWVWVVVKVYGKEFYKIEEKFPNGDDGKEEEYTPKIHDDEIALELGNCIQEWTGDTNPLASFRMVSANRDGGFGFYLYSCDCLLYFPKSCCRSVRKNIDFKYNDVAFTIEFSNENPKGVDDFTAAHGNGIFYKKDEFSGRFFKGEAPSKRPDTKVSQSYLDQVIKSMNEEFNSRLAIQEDQFEVRTKQTTEQMNSMLKSLESFQKEFGQLEEKFHQLEIQRKSDCERIEKLEEKVQILTNEVGLPEPRTTPVMKMLKLSNDNVPHQTIGNIENITPQTSTTKKGRYYN